MKLRMQLAWLLVATLLLASSTCSWSRPLVAAAGAADGVGGEKMASAARRSLGSRTPPAPPAPLPNKTKSYVMPVPGSPPAV
uniref:Uncharacterized protein n=1 Tax=Oryza meridionalis TaxID=40149 RepID=A0A0E0DXX2_9ORYZ